MPNQKNRAAAMPRKDGSNRGGKRIIGDVLRREIDAPKAGAAISPLQDGDFLR
jgi:hypothetical protein